MGAIVFHRPSGESTSAADEERGQIAQSPDTRMLPSANSASVAGACVSAEGATGFQVIEAVSSTQFSVAPLYTNARPSRRARRRLPAPLYS